MLCELLIPIYCFVVFTLISVLFITVPKCFINFETPTLYYQFKPRMNELNSIFIIQTCTDIPVSLVLIYNKQVMEPKKACF